MTGSQLAWSRIRAGRWEAEVTAAGKAAPQIELWHLDRRLDGVMLGERTAEGRWPVAFTIPADLLSDGVQTFLVRDGGDGQPIGQFAIVTGEPLQGDIRAEVELLRAEIDMLKKAFRRHCVETAGG